MSCDEDLYYDPHVKLCLSCRDICDNEADENACPRLCSKYLEKINSTVPLPPDGNLSNSTYGLRIPLIVIIVCVTLVLIVGAISIFIFYRKKQEKRHKKLDGGSKEALCSNRIPCQQFENSPKPNTNTMCFLDEENLSLLKGHVSSPRECESDIPKKCLPDIVPGVHQGTENNAIIRSPKSIPHHNKATSTSTSIHNHPVNLEKAGHNPSASQINKKQMPKTYNKQLRDDGSIDIHKSLLKPRRRESQNEDASHATQPKCTDEISDVASSQTVPHSVPEQSSHDSLHIKPHSEEPRRVDDQTSPQGVVLDTVAVISLNRMGSSMFRERSISQPRTLRQDSFCLSLSLRADDYSSRVSNHQRVEDFLRHASSNHWDSIMNIYELLEANLDQFPWVVGCMITNDHIEVVIDTEGAGISIDTAYNKLMEVVPDGKEQHLMVSEENSNTQNS